jgi:hypothetical protein
VRLETSAVIVYQADALVMKEKHMYLVCGTHTGKERNTQNVQVRKLGGKANLDDLGI